jgi:hypothetical protein
MEHRGRGIPLLALPEKDLGSLATSLVMQVAMICMIRHLSGPRASQAAKTSWALFGFARPKW